MKIRLEDVEVEEKSMLDEVALNESLSTGPPRLIDEAKAWIVQKKPIPVPSVEAGPSEEKRLELLTSVARVATFNTQMFGEAADKLKQRIANWPSAAAITEQTAALDERIVSLFEGLMTVQQRVLDARSNLETTLRRVARFEEHAGAADDENRRALAERLEKQKDLVADIRSDVHSLQLDVCDERRRTLHESRSFEPSFSAGLRVLNFADLPANRLENRLLVVKRRLEEIEEKTDGTTGNE